ncbi:MAG TPA: tRNA 2-thiocytidine biosynthesis TtcA family protein [Prolixibacteraceae bacterium]|nr:tRNA 2-thiocytidine biosynthesis TtcA family protein [Prolixibacteraceae bacterium]
MGNKKSLEHLVIRRVNQKVGKAIQKYHLIEEGDRILIGLSGGKDSMVLLETLAGRLKFHPLKFKLAAIHIGLESQPYSVDIEYLKSFTENLQIPFIHKLVSVDISDNHNSNPCFKCSWNRRKALFQVAQESGFNKLALGHHMDDAIETLLMNMTLQSSISSMPPALPMFENKLIIIRPLSLLTEEEVKEFAVQKNYKREIKTCLYEKDSKRSEIKKLITQLAQFIPNVRSNLYASMTNLQSEYLPNEKY